MGAPCGELQGEHWLGVGGWEPPWSGLGAALGLVATHLVPGSCGE